jgi:1-acyl-sn-glycerol-3-phosphate acyltransferase
MAVIKKLFRSAIHFLAIILCLSIAAIVGLFYRETGITIIIAWCRFLFWLYDIDLSVQNDNDSMEDLKGCVFTLLNQTSLLDGPAGMCVSPRPCRGIVNLEYALIPFFGWCMWVFCIVIIRQWPSQARKSMARVEAFLQNGGNVWMSIEGRRSKDGSLSPFKKGPAVLAIRAQAMIVPVVIHGSNKCLGYGKIGINSGRVVVRLLKAIPTAGMQYEDREMLVNQLLAVAECEVKKN